ncbi:hypothetical protein B0H19DRAFT_230518 [Mycena capillaripes]|nr:hypothetical protein B0H19DRAFT_230518 [Mycena capillaripes]
MYLPFWTSPLWSTFSSRLPSFRMVVRGNEHRRSLSTLSVTCSRKVERCFLKIFPPDPANTIRFKAECAANHALNLHASESVNGDDPEVLTGPQSLEVFKTHLQLSNLGLSWPLCYGYISKRQQTHPPKLHGLLFQFYDDLTLVSPDDIDEGGLMQTKILRALAPIHAARILHRDLEERTVWPAAGFRNIFLKSDGEPVVLDFDHSQLITEDKDRKRLEEEEAQMRVDGQGGGK